MFCIWSQYDGEACTWCIWTVGISVTVYCIQSMLFNTFYLVCLALYISFNPVLLIQLAEGCTPLEHRLFPRKSLFPFCPLVRMFQRSSLNSEITRFKLAKHVGFSINATFQRFISSFFQRSNAGFIPPGTPNIQPWVKMGSNVSVVLMGGTHQYCLTHFNTQTSCRPPLMQKQLCYKVQYYKNTYVWSKKM